MELLFFVCVLSCLSVVEITGGHQCRLQCDSLTANLIYLKENGSIMTQCISYLWELRNKLFDNRLVKFGVP